MFKQIETSAHPSSFDGYAYITAKSISQSYHFSDEVSVKTQKQQYMSNL